MSIRALAVTALIAATPAAAFDLADMTDAERESFRIEVRQYLLENPEVLMEAIGVLEQREREAQAAADLQLAAIHAEAIFNDGHSFVGGNPDGDITLVEFMDYRCGYCRQAFGEVAQLLETDGNIRFIVKELPILGEQSLMASRFAVAVQQLHGDAIYEEIHNALMSFRADITPDTLARLAEGFSLDPAPIMARMDSPEVAAVIDANRQLADLLQISGTPTFVLEDRMIRGYVPLPTMQQLVSASRAD